MSVKERKECLYLHRVPLNWNGERGGGGDTEEHLVPQMGLLYEE